MSPQYSLRSVRCLTIVRVWSFLLSTLGRGTMMKYEFFRSGPRTIPKLVIIVFTILWKVRVNRWGAALTRGNTHEITSLTLPGASVYQLPLCDFLLRFSTTPTFEVVAKCYHFVSDFCALSGERVRL